MQMEFEKPPEEETTASHLVPCQVSAQTDLWSCSQRCTPHLAKKALFHPQKVVFAHSLILSLANFQRRLIYRVDLVARWLAWSRAPLLRLCQASYSFNSLPMWSYNNNVMT